MRGTRGKHKRRSVDKPPLILSCLCCVRRADPEGFHLAIVAKVAELYLGLSGEGTEYRGKPTYPSDLVVAFEAAGLGEPDFAFFQDFARRARHALRLAPHPTVFALASCVERQPCLVQARNR